MPWAIELSTPEHSPHQSVSTSSQEMHLFIQEDLSFEIRLEVLHFGPDLFLHHCIQGDSQLVQLRLQGGQVCSLLQKTGNIRGTNSCGSTASQQPLPCRPRAGLALNVEEQKQQDARNNEGLWNPAEAWPNWAQGLS